MPNTTNFTLPYPQSSDTPDVPRDIQALAGAVDTRLLQTVRVFATTTARDAAITSPTAGMICYVDSGDASEGLYTYHGTSWRKGPGWNAPWGNLPAGTRALKTATQTINATSVYTDVTGLTLTDTLVGNRLIRVEAFVFITPGNANTIDVQLTDGTASTQYQQVSLSTVFGSTQGYAYLTALLTTSAGSATFKIRVRSDSTSASWTVVGGSATAPSLLTITDVGPSGAPA